MTYSLVVGLFEKLYIYWLLINLSIFLRLISFFLDDPEFTEVIRQAEAAIDAGINPQRIYQVDWTGDGSTHREYIR